MSGFRSKAFVSHLGCRALLELLEGSALEQLMLQALPEIMEFE